MAFDKAEYWANKGKKPAKPPVGANTLVCSACMEFSLAQIDPRARHLAARAAARGPFVRLRFDAPDGKPQYKHQGCPRGG